MTYEGSLINQLLVAMPSMQDPNFSATVTLICQHNDEGALGIIINRPLNIRLGGLFEQLDMQTASPSRANDAVMLGGPVGPERGFVLHGNDHDYENSIAVSSEINLTLSRDVLDAMAAGAGPEKALVALGYAGWEPGQLEDEMLANSWLTVPANSELVFDTPYPKRWYKAAESIGIDLTQISPDAGHA